MTTSDYPHIDYEFLAGLLLEIVQERSPQQLLQKLVRRMLERFGIIMVVWLIDDGDELGADMPGPSPDQTRWLYAVAGGASVPPGTAEHPRRLPDHLARIPVGVGPIGRIAETRQPLMVIDLDKEPGELAAAGDWFGVEQIRGFFGAPIVYKDEVLGVLAAFTPLNMSDEASRWGRVFADHVAGAIANARAFDEICAAGKRLDQANQRLGRELAEREETEEKLRKSEQQYRRIVDTASEGIWELDDQYATTLVNPRMAEMLGYEPEEMAGRAFAEFLFEDDLADHRMRIAARRQGLAERFERRFRRKDGCAVWMQVSATPILDAQRRFLGSFAMMTDITERKRAEEGLRRLNRELRAISNCNQVLLRATDEQTLLQEVCRIVCEEAGYRVAWVGFGENDEAKSVRPVAWTGTDVGYLASLGITWADTERGHGIIGTAIRTGRTSCVDDYATDPRVAPWRQSASQHGFRSAIALPLKGEHANTLGSLNIYSAQPNAFTSEEIRLLEELADDLAFGIVTLRSRIAREQAEQKVSLLSFAMDNVHEAAFLIDDRGRFRYVNEDACRVLGFTRAQLLGMVVSDIDPEFPAEDWSDHWRNLVAQRSLSFESSHRAQDGRIFPVEVSVSYFEYGDRPYHLAFVRDITERKRAEEALRRNEAYLVEGQRLAHMGSWAWSPATRQALYWSEGMFRVFGLDPQDGAPTTEAFWQRIHPDDLDRTREVLLKAAAGNMEYEHDHRIVLPDGTVKHIHAVGHPVLDQHGQVAEYVGTAVDVTERRKSEEETRLAFEEIQKLKEQLEQQNEYLREEVVEAKAFGDLVGQSAALGQVVSQIDLVAPTDASVMIQGETGTGKELVAHEIHRRSRRRDKPLVRVNCASIPTELYESEFFGHVKGAFTGAVKDRAGRFETAEGGTLFLDEIAEVPLDLQSKLLRVLQEKRYERVGEDRTRRADVRIITATNRDLKKEAEAGRFREDLYYRLHVFPIHVAPLRQRKEDIPLLAQHFVERSVNELRCRKPRLTRAGIVRLQCYDWPGNVRELQNVIERAVILARGGVLEFDLPVRDAPPAKRPETRLADDAAPEFLTEAQLRQRERENLLAVLDRAHWKIRGAGGAAELLGVKATTLLSRMKAMGLKRPD